ncbi:uncharacterized protein LOC125233063 [Leguminivora glycinivorella]|uniref:uncharacterized protein LOC125233063 n=1 Tax=Leguminivora glycinivorella TaxID=1035111 RepID=UPI00200D2AB7|nr:uncharacterized protein LOC125233063 [Leguminivora glycinivorella]
MDLKIFTALCLLTAPCTAVRLQRLFELVDGGSALRYDSNLEGFLHIGNDYSIFLRTPVDDDKHLIYELYETKNIPNTPSSHDYKPSVIAISQIPIDYIKEQLLTYRDELHNATYTDDSIVPGTQVMTLREWQIAKALRQREENGTNTPLRSEPLVLRMLD